MGNTNNIINMGATSSKKAAKVMKINGELIKLKTPAKVYDIIKDYPDHILLDSEEFLKFNLRANPLDPEAQLKPKKIYLLVELPKFPSPLRRVQSGVSESTVGKKIMTVRSVSDVSSIMTRSTAGSSSSGSDDGCGGPTRRVKMRVPKAMVDKIMAESKNEVEVAEKILRLSNMERENHGGGATVAPVVEDGGCHGEERESTRERMCSPWRGYHRKYKKLSS